MNKTKTAYPTQTREEGEVEKPRRYTLATESGCEVTVERLTEDDLTCAEACANSRRSTA